MFKQAGLAFFLTISFVTLLGVAADSDGLSTTVAPKLNASQSTLTTKQTPQNASKTTAPIQTSQNVSKANATGESTQTTTVAKGTQNVNNSTPAPPQNRKANNTSSATDQTTEKTDNTSTAPANESTATPAQPAQSTSQITSVQPAQTPPTPAKPTQTSQATPSPAKPTQNTSQATSAPTQPTQNTSQTEQITSQATPTTGKTTSNASNTTSSSGQTTHKDNNTSPSPGHTTHNASNTTPPPGQTTHNASNATPPPGQTTHNASNTTPPPGQTTQSASKTTSVSSTGKPSGTSSSPVVHDKVYINEIMVNKQGVFQKIELSMSASANISHYAVVIVEGSTSKFSSFYLKDVAKQEKNGYFTISFNTTLHVVKELGTGIAVYDTNVMRELGQQNWTVSSRGLMDALVIGKTYNISTQLLNILTPESSPFVLDPRIYGIQKTISRCSLDSVKSTDMFILTDSSLGDNNNGTCSAKINQWTALVLKFDGNCQTMNDTMVTEIMKYVVTEVNKGCHCGITRLHIRDTKVSCCDSTMLKINFVTPNDVKDTHLPVSYKHFIRTTPAIHLAKKTYQLDKKCDYDYKSCCDQYRSCCEQPKPIKQSDTGKNVKVTVAAVIACLLVFLIIVVIVIVYMKRKKTVNYQFRMSRLREDDDDLMMDTNDTDDFVGGQEATFDIMKT